ncbi:MAG: Gfo/Idh/MocA family oxidoreductase [Verrucomicrobiota bacterium]|nr:Gfo/Idh/MocA family oxidoreductase [Verrucomicrobiota bacterium]
MKPLGLAIIGAGASQMMYGPAFTRLKEARPVAWVDPDKTRAESAASKFGGTAYAHFEEALAQKDVDAVVLVSPPWLHLPQAKAAFEAGKHVLCEKPMARSVAECQQMIDSSKTHDRLLMVAFMKRFNPALKYVKQQIDSGELGKVFEVKVEWSWPQYHLGGWRDKRQNLGGLFFDHGSHTIDLCRWWLGELESVSAEVRLLMQGREVEDFTQAVYRHKSGAISTHANSRMTHRPLRECYTIEGSKATLTLECINKWSFTSLEPFVVHKYVMGQATRLPEGYFCSIDDAIESDWMYLNSLRYFCTSILENKPPEYNTGMDGLKAVEGINGAYMASHFNKTLALPLVDPYDPDLIFDALLAKSPLIPAH